MAEELFQRVAWAVTDAANSLKYLSTAASAWSNQHRSRTGTARPVPNPIRSYKKIWRVSLKPGDLAVRALTDDKLRYRSQIQISVGGDIGGEYGFGGSGRGEKETP